MLAALLRQRACGRLSRHAAALLSQQPESLPVAASCVHQQPYVSGGNPDTGKPAAWQSPGLRCLHTSLTAAESLQVEAPNMGKAPTCLLVRGH